MEIGITWENKLVYNKEIKVNKKAIKNGLVITGVGVISIALLMAIMPTTRAYAFPLNGGYDIAQTNKNGQVIMDAIKNTAQYKDLELFFKCYDSYFEVGGKTLRNIFTGYPGGYDSLTKDAVEVFSKVSSEINIANADSLFEALLERMATYPRSEVEVIKLLKNCIFN